MTEHLVFTGDLTPADPVDRLPRKPCRGCGLSNEAVRQIVTDPRWYERAVS